MQPCAAVVINPEEVPEKLRLLKQTGCRIYASVESMWAEERGSIDLCMIPTSIGTHYKFAKMALESGSHVFLEKPVCGTIQEATALAELSEKLGLEICVGFQDLYCQDVREIKRRLLEGSIGKIKRIHGWGSWPRATAYYERNSWAGQLKDNGSWVLDSPVNNAMAHFLMLLLFWSGQSQNGFGHVQSIKADLHRAQNIQSFDTASMVLGLDNDLEVFYGVTHSGEENLQVFLTIEGEDGSIEWEHFNEIRINTPSGTEIMGFGDINSLREGMIEQVCRWIEDREGEVVRVAEASLLTRIVNGLHQGFPIREFSSDQVSLRAHQDQVFHFVRGLQDDLRKACEKGALLSELRPEQYGPAPKPFPLGDYSVFSGTYAGSHLVSA